MTILSFDGDGQTAALARHYAGCCIVISPANVARKTTTTLFLCQCTRIQNIGILTMINGNNTSGNTGCGSRRARRGQGDTCSVRFALCETE